MSLYSVMLDKSPTFDGKQWRKVWAPPDEMILERLKLRQLDSELARRTSPKKIANLIRRIHACEVRLTAAILARK